jgi:hypothetical protein
MPDLTPAEARAFLKDLEVLSKQHGIALAAGYFGPTGAVAMGLVKVDPSGSYTFAETNFSDGSIQFDQIEWQEPKG